MSNNNSSGKALGTGSNSFGTATAALNVHPQYDYWKKSWEILRDTSRGSIAVKKKRKTYLPELDSQTADEYKSYLDRATYFNMVGRTVNGLTGTIFQRAPKVQDLPKRLLASTANITQDNKSLNDFTKLIAQEVITTGRYGVLQDMPSFSESEP